MPATARAADPAPVPLKDTKQNRKLAAAATAAATAGAVEGLSPQEEPGFLRTTVERVDLNQYWYSQHTIAVFVAEIEAHIGGQKKGGEHPERTVALVSCPSIYFSLEDEARAHCLLLDIDRQWEDDPGFVGWGRFVKNSFCDG